MDMQALVLHRYNGPLELTTLSRPVPQTGELLVRIMAAGLNPLDTKIRAGSAAHAKHPLPLVLGIDMAGVIEAVGEGVTQFKTGDEVYGMTGGVAGIQGSLAQFAAVDARLIALKPSNLSMKEAAALPLSFITSYQGIVDRARVQAGQTVLVQGGAGGVGHVSVQLAKALGARVFATVSEADVASMARYGATGIDYQKFSVEQYVNAHTNGEGFDVVADTVGGATLDASFSAVKQFGHVVSALGWGTHALAPLSFREASYSGVFTLAPLLTGKHREHHGEILRAATALVEDGKLVPKLDPGSFDLKSAEAAYQSMTEGAASGKLVIEIS
ncbi:quinone oxidoreductase [Burkholderia sp. Leaf177]|uniref:zinc-dependent alcohol dehydrogenase family protein n=1 Tax=Burkholderia sp. Leaf177 TaxID=1736287 RepID=UPI0006FEFD7D|nr:zinc-dependent alcohol dehydrogenase family protein [Burkholderia sp. Leaf177]KQR79004.1 quinone oxidoreductase [Burkholderia sp. Leaf177]